MKLVQKLPLGVALATCMMMSSCSQEDVQMAEPKQTNVHSSSKVAANPSMPATNGWVGQGVVPSGWTQSSYDGGKTVCGTSTITNLYGNPLLPWIKPLPLPGQSAANNAGNFITLMRQKKFLDPASSTFSHVHTKITNLTPGKKYAFTFKVASTITTKLGQITQYAPTFQVEVNGAIGSVNGTGSILVDLVGKEAEWITKTISFIAQDSEAQVNFKISCSQEYYNSHNKFFFYGHVYVPQNTVVEIP